MIPSYGMLNAFASWDLSAQKERALLVQQVAREVIFQAQPLFGLQKPGSIDFFFMFLGQ